MRKSSSRCRALFYAAAAVLFATTSAQAGPITVNYTFIYEPPVENQTYPGTSRLSGTLQFYTRLTGSSDSPANCGAGIAIGQPLGLVPFVPEPGAFSPGEACFNDLSNEILFSFEGTVTGSPSTPQAYAFLDDGNIPSVPPTEQILLGSLAATNPLDVAGLIYGFSDPVRNIGEFDIHVTLADVAPVGVPEPPTLPLLGLGAGVLIVLQGKRRALLAARIRR